ncbi:ORF6N domain-containing protein [Serratia fonticola]|uniref:ORF6N domain-containing protein n=1 Tax=Serratia fonticola TaxID=47917 RepID=A0AAW3WLU5_SERFO|nr:ORF6N domain-containing protein [Serratia fonticola]MBC3211410.1 ORF6N domain-containing protein [Serratia fonticola]NYA12393.1 ORF6N domain-containing protein [Serratia fonticola]NYA31972.1 ORF6N domain-containing protein [Serratia fonticola]
MAKKTELVAVEAKDLQIIEYHGQRVATTEQLAAGYGTDVENIRRNFNRNKSRFVEGKHYFQISGNELENLRISFSPAQISNKTRSLTLWTERGAANHAKMLETDQAWEYYNDLTEFYFTRRDAIAAPVDAMQLLNDPSTLRNLLLNYSGDNERLKGENQQLVSTVESLGKHFTKGMTIPAFCKCLNGVNINKMMWWAFERNWIFNEQRDPEKSARWRVASYARDTYLTEDEMEIKPHGKEAFTKKTPVLLEKGCHRLYALYMKGELPMKATWNGEFSHDKATYTPEAGQ